MTYSDADVKVKGYKLTRAQVMEINCQECGAKPGERCETESGVERHEPHFMRAADRNEGTDPGPTKTRTQRRMEIIQAGAQAYLIDVLRRAVKDKIITKKQFVQIACLTDAVLDPGFTAIVEALE
jgi:hypothetical protein